MDNEDEVLPRKDYFAKMGINKNKGTKHEKALNRAHEIRKFEIGLYWERSKYMYVMVAAIFGAVVFAKEPHMKIFLSFTGMILSFAWVLINKGSRYWQENWEAHIDYLEDEIEGSLYKTVNETENPENGFSVSKINILISEYSFLSFSGLFVLKILPKLSEITYEVFSSYLYITFTVLAVILFILFLFKKIMHLC